jgi:hypothetical protein
MGLSDIQILDFFFFQLLKGKCGKIFIQKIGKKYISEIVLDLSLFFQKLILYCSMVGESTDCEVLTQKI